MPQAEEAAVHPPVIPVIALGVIAVGRAVWFLLFIGKCWKAKAGTGFWRRIAAAVGHSRTLTTTRLLSQDAGAKAHQGMLAQEERRLETILVGGAIALAAWTQVFVSSENSPADRLSGVTLALLFGGAMILLSSPLLFRREGLHLTFIGRESATFLGYGAIVLSMCGAVLDLVSGYWMVVAVVLAAVIALRDLIDVCTHLKLMKNLNF